MSYVSRFTGRCNQCGQCCTQGTGDDRIVCEYLERVGELGTPMATRCLVQHTRTHMLPILMRRELDGQPWSLSFCAKDSPEEDAVIAARGIGRGCSLVPA